MILKIDIGKIIDEILDNHKEARREAVKRFLIDKESFTTDSIDEDPDFVDAICEIWREQERVHLLRKLHGIEEP